MEEDSGPFAATVETVAQLGISIEPIDQVLLAQGALNTKNMAVTLHQPSSSGLTTSNLEMAHRILESVSVLSAHKKVIDILLTIRALFPF